jgi:signal transduction histidine kinase
MNTFAKRIISTIMLLLVLFISSTASANQGGEWSSGKVDATSWAPPYDGSLSLNGAWAFYWNQLLDPSSFQEQEQALDLDFIQVPAQWGGLTWRDEHLTNQGFGTYRLQVELPLGIDNRTLALYVRSVATSYRLYVNGELLAVNGEVGVNRQSMVARNVPQVIYFQPKSGDNELIIQVSNFVQRKGGIWESIYLGDAQTITQERSNRIMLEIFTFGCLFIMGVYHIGLFYFRKKDKAPLYFGVLCLAVGVRTLVLGETLGMSMLPYLPWEIGVKVEYLSALIAFMMILLFVNTQYPSKLSALTNKGFGIVQSGIACLILLSAADTYTRIMLSYQLLVAVPIIIYAISIYIWAARTRKEGSIKNFIGFILLTAAVANDILYYNQVIATGSWIPLGLLFFLLTQSLNVASRYSKSFKTTEMLSNQLQNTNARLEQKVIERTGALSATNVRLEEVNKELHKSEQFRLQLLANISHELNTPITSVKGFAKAMMDDIIVADYPRYAKRIYDRTLLLERIIEDLIELTKLETRQLSFHFEEQPALQLLRRMFDQYETELFEDDGNRLIWDDSAMALSTDQEMFIRVDVVRLEQVFSNLLSNAQKYASNKGDIRITVQLLTQGVDEHSLLVQVIDPGPGIADVDMPFIFNRFYRSKHGASSRQGGSGLGLTICKEIMEYHHGRIGYTREVATGSAFYFQLPARFVSFHPSA